MQKYTAQGKTVINVLNQNARDIRHEQEGLDQGNSGNMRTAQGFMPHREKTQKRHTREADMRLCDSHS